MKKMQMKNNLRIMTIQIFQEYKKLNNTIPKCVSCGLPILVGFLFERLKGARKTKYLCKECSEKDVCVYQYPMSKRQYDGNRKNDTGSRHSEKKDFHKWIHGIAEYTSQ
jgi:hypothetical protein